MKLLEKVEKSVLTEEVELRRTNGVYEVDVTFNGKVTVPMVFDTGASLTTISSELAAQIGLKPSPSSETLLLSVADGSVIKAKRMSIPSLRVGKFTVNDVELRRHAGRQTGRAAAAWPELSSPLHLQIHWGLRPPDRLQSRNSRSTAGKVRSHHQERIQRPPPSPSEVWASISRLPTVSEI